MSGELKKVDTVNDRPDMNADCVRKRFGSFFGGLHKVIVKGFDFFHLLFLYYEVSANDNYEGNLNHMLCHFKILGIDDLRYETLDTFYIITNSMKILFYYQIFKQNRLLKINNNQ